MPEYVSVEPAVPHFETVDDLRRGLAAKSNFEAVDLYPRDGSRILGEVEAMIARLAGVDEDELLVYNSGMAAVTEAIDAALDQSADNVPVLAFAQETYTQTKRYIDNFIRGRRAEVIYFDSGDTQSVNRLFENRHPDVVVCESIANFVNVPVLNAGHLLENLRNQEDKPVVVIDNTLPLSTALPLGEMIAANDPVIVVESGTKSYTFNSETLGISYTKNQDLRDYLLRYRRTRGTMPSLQSLNLAGDIVPQSREIFDERNFGLFRHTAEIAIALSELSGGSSGFIISHPALPDHENHMLYKEQYPDEGTPIFYIQSSKYDQYEVAKILWAHPDVQDQAKLGQSFGFDHTRIVADENVGAVRISGGAFTDGVSFGEACAEALYG